MNENTVIIGFIIVLLLIFYNLKMDKGLVLNKNLQGKNKNATNIGFVKPEHRLLKIFSSVSSGSKIKLGIFSDFLLYLIIRPYFPLHDHSPR